MGTPYLYLGVLKRVWVHIYILVRTMSIIFGPHWFRVAAVVILMDRLPQTLQSSQPVSQILNLTQHSYGTHDVINSYKCILLNPYLDNPHSWIIWSPIEITLLSWQCLSAPTQKCSEAQIDDLGVQAAFVQKPFIMKDGQTYRYAWSGKSTVIFFQTKWKENKVGRLYSIVERGVRFL